MISFEFRACGKVLLAIQEASGKECRMTDVCDMKYYSLLVELGSGTKPTTAFNYDKAVK